jgi:hypothetical protein
MSLVFGVDGLEAAEGYDSVTNKSEDIARVNRRKRKR